MTRGFGGSADARSAHRPRWLILGVAAIVLMGGTTGYALIARANYARDAATSLVGITRGAEPEGARIVFRNTALGELYGFVSAVPLNEPDGPRAVGELACDRVYATSATEVCLQTTPGLLSTFRAVTSRPGGPELSSWPLAGLPSRTRLSPDGTLVATTVFVTGHSYAPESFSTATVISAADGSDPVNLESFALWVGDSVVASTDRNLWGVTFAPDDTTFYATARAAGSTWLVRGDIAKRRLDAVAPDAECPSLSPDGTRVAYKKNLATGAGPRWGIAVLELDSGRERVLPESRSIDDQVEWLNDDTLLYGIPRTDTVGDSDVWAASADGSTAPELFIEHAWSPSVVR